MKREIEYQIDLDNLLLFEKISGDFNIGELVNYKYQLHRYNVLDEIDNFITDISQMELEFNEYEFVKSIESISRNHSIIGNKKHAIIIDNSKQAEWAEYLMLSLLSLQIKPNVKLFLDADKAKNWLLN